MRKGEKLNMVQDIGRLRFRFLEIVVIKEASKRKRVQQAGSARKEAVGVKVAFTFNYYNGKRVGPRC